MDNLGILVQAILSLKDTTSSKNQIAKELPKLESQLQSDKNTRVKIVAGLDIAKSKSLIQSQLNTLANQAKAPAIKIGIDTSGLNSVQGATQNITNSLKNVQTQAQQTASAVERTFTTISADNISDKIVKEFQNSFGIIGKKASETKAIFKDLFATLNNAWYAGDLVKYNSTLTKIYDTTIDNVNASKQLSKEAKNIVDFYKNQLTDGSKVFIDPNVRTELEYILGTSEKIKSVLCTVFGVGKWSYQSGISVDSLSNLIHYDDEIRSSADSIVDAYNKIQQAKSQNSNLLYDTKYGTDAIKQQAQSLLNLKDVYVDLNGVEHNFVEGLGWFEEIGGESDKVNSSLNDIQIEAKETSDALSKIGHNFISNNQIQATFGSLKQAEEYFEGLNLGDVSLNLNKGSLQGLKDFTITVKSAKGEVEKFSYAVHNIGDDQNPIPEYVLQNINAANAGVKKLQDDIEKAKANAQKTLASFDNKSMGLFSKTDVYKKTSEALKNITDFDSISKFNNAMAELEAHYQKITAYTRSGSKSLNPFINAINDMAGMEEQIKRIKASADGLQNKSKSLIGNLGSLNRLADNVNKHAVGTEEWGQAYEKLKNKIAQVNDQIKTAKVEQKTTDSFAQKQQNMYSVIEQRMKQINQLKIQQLSTDESTSRIIQEQINSYTNQINGIKGNMSKYGYADKTLDNEVEKLKVELDYKYRIAQSEKENRVQQQSNNELLKFQTDTLREINAEYEKIVANKKAMASTKSEENKSIYANRIAESEKIIANDMEMLKDANLLTEEINQQVASKRQYVSEQEKIIANTEQIKREQELNQVFKSQITEVEKYKNTINEIIGTLQNLQNSKTFTNNASNLQVTETRNKITALIAEYQKLLTQLDGKVTPATIENLNAELTQLNTQFNDATTTAKRFETELRNGNGAEQLAQKVALLTQRIKAYRQANSKSEKKFGSRYDSMLSQLANPNIDLNTYNALNKQFQKMRQEINAANVAGKNLWQTLKEKAGKFVGWMSMTYAVSMFARSIREAVTELKEVDTVLTEISKANDKLTDSQLAQIGSNSFGISSKYGKTATDYLTGVQEMSRAGYANAEAMGELSTAAQGAGDMTADVANQFIIAADKAYKMNGSVEELTKTLDGINYITNNNAVNMSELSEGFSIVSSTAAASGVSAKELTAALGTMAATTQQSGSEVARAFRAILLNIRQVSDEEENIDAEGLTKYEKACNALGVSLKEVKDGVLQLRDPMQVLKELSIEYNKLSETDLKRTNLLNSVGGKLRSTQLDALLRQWSMYEEMLQQYEAGNGSMAREANNYCLVA